MVSGQQKSLMAAFGLPVIAFAKPLSPMSGPRLERERCLPLNDENASRS